MRDDRSDSQRKSASGNEQESSYIDNVLETKSGVAFAREEARVGVDAGRRSG
jgi:hypothetical protein